MAHPLQNESIFRPHQPLRIESVTDRASLRALGPAWNQLHALAAPDHPFLSHDWIESWWEAFGGDKKLNVLTVWSGAELVAVMPLMLRQCRIYGIPARRLETIGNSHTPRWDLLVAPGYDQIHGELWRHLDAARASWDVLLLTQLPAESRTLELWPALAEEAGMLTGRWSSLASPRVPVRGPWEEYDQSLGRKHRANLRNRSKRLSRVGPVVEEIIEGGDALAAALEDGWRIEGAAWKGAEGTAIASSPETKRFYERYAERAAARGLLRIRFLRAGEKRVAFMYNLRYGNEEYIVKQGYDPAFAPYSPSVLLAQRVLEEAWRDKLTGVDFLGNDDSWKMRYTQERRRHYWLFVFPDRLRSRLIHAAKFRVLPALKSWTGIAKPKAAAPEAPESEGADES
jgi:CelD/BcsL family acetyltransferase involved in cellulose biosynthesis